MSKFLTFDVSKLLSKPTGTREKYTVEAKIKLEDLNLKSDLKTSVEVMRVDEGFNARLVDMEIEVEVPCDRCLKLYAQPIHISSVDRTYFLEKPLQYDDVNDLFLVDKKHLTINISEMLRQEIILHFPTNLVCSSGCKGLCKICGKDKNKSKCKCKEEKIDEGYKPLSKLKELLK